MTDLFNYTAHPQFTRSLAGPPGVNHLPDEGVHRVLVIDDDDVCLAMVQAMLAPHFHVDLASSARLAAQQISGDEAPDLILLDLVMPEMDGYSFIQRHQAALKQRDIPVILLTGCDDTDAEAQALAHGASDFVRKPYRAPALLARMSAQLERKREKTRLKSQNAKLKNELTRQTQENHALQHLSFRAMTRLAEARDQDTGRHMQRTQALVRHLTQCLRQLSPMGESWDEQWAKDMTAAAPLHDIGKVGLPDQILHNSGRLTPEDRLVMQQHTVLGAEAIGRAAAETGHRLDFLAMAKDMARHHHERWDGTGYPDRLAGEAIPLTARIMAVADVFDALVAPRVYKSAMNYDEAFQIMSEGRGTQFDPQVLDVFLANYRDFCAIASRELT